MARCGSVYAEECTRCSPGRSRKAPDRNRGLQGMNQLLNGAIMQNNTVNVNTQCSLSPEEMEMLLCAEIEMTGRGMEYGLQYFADMRDRNIAAQKQLIALRAGQGA